MVTMTDKLIVKYKNEIYDITEFRRKHPGGLDSLNCLMNMDIGYKFNNTPPHSAAARYLINEYRINDIQGDASYRNGIDDTVNTDLYSQTDASMEHLVDWSKPMIPQIGKLGNQYSDWVHKPVDRPLRLFYYDFLEILTKTPWWLVPVYWIPVIIYLIYDGIKEYDNRYLVTNIIGGVFLWTILEYSLHRWVFHLNSTNASAFICTFHFLLHGLHHKVPFDPQRLVFPPIPATMIAFAFYQPLILLSNYPKLVLAGGILGYLCYDMIHYYLHHGSPSGGHLYYMKRYHYQHHFTNHSRGFGISSSVWDEAFGTQIILRKLKYLLKW